MLQWHGGKWIDTPVQSLFLINSQRMLQRAKAFADRLQKESGKSDAESVARAYRLAFGRAPNTDETAAALAFLNEQKARIDPNNWVPETNESDNLVWSPPIP